ncbi:MAG: hypothetical protein ACYC28_06405 [Longimicrobiales bacterium]
MYRQRVRAEPRISVNKLGDYLVATPARRKSILAQQKTPPTFMVTYYDDAHQVIREFYEHGGADDRIITRGIERLEARMPESDFEEQRTQGSVEALSSFLDSLDELDLDGFEVRPGAVDPPKLVLRGVAISVRPDLVLTRDGQPAGAVKFAFSKGTMVREAAEYVACTVHRYVEEVMGSSQPNPRDTLVLDVFARRVLRAPRSFVRRRKDVDAACEEISARWASL